MTYVKDTKKAPLAVALAVLAAMGYGGYTIIQEKELESLRSGEVATYKVERVIDGDTFQIKS